MPLKTPLRYRDQLLTGEGGLLKLEPIKGTGPSARELTRGLLGAFQPDLVVETKPGLANGIGFDQGRVLSFDRFNEADGNGRRTYGIDLRSVCRTLYKEEFRFVQRHPPIVVEPRPTDRRYGLLFAAIFGEFPTSGVLGECKEHFREALDAKEKEVKPDSFHELLTGHSLFPLRVGAYKLVTRTRGWSPDPALFYMDESEPYDIIEYWNLRALGWRIRPLPRLLAPKLKAFSEKFIVESHQPYPPPSNACHDASFLCSRSCAFDEMQKYVIALERPSSCHVSTDWRVPRLWEEWGRHADHAEPQVVEFKTESQETSSWGNSLAVATVVPQFVQDHIFDTPRHACTNVLEKLPGGAPVIPWQMIDMRFLAGQLQSENIWVGREGICTTAGAYHSRRHFRLPSSLNVFASWAQKNQLEIELSPAGRVAEQLIAAIGGLSGVRMVGNEELIKLLDRMANGTLEIDATQENESGPEKRRLRKASVPLYQIKEVLKRVNYGNEFIADNHLSALLRSNVLTLGMEVSCSHCGQTTWFALNQLSTRLKCQRCLDEFDFPATKPHRNTWSYRVQGPFAIEDYGYGAYCVAAALQFLSDEFGAECTWIPSFRLTSKSENRVNSEADFAAFVRPGRFGLITDPLLIFGECKTFGNFDLRDYRRMKTLAKSFPGAIICFCTLKNALTQVEKKKISALAGQGRRSLESGKLMNPVVVLTGTELLGQFKNEPFTTGYPPHFSKLGEGAFMRGDVQEICDFLQQVHLGIESIHEWRRARREGQKKKPVQMTPLQAPSHRPGNQAG